MIIGYTLYAQEPAKFDFYRGAPESIFCPSCADVLDRDYAPADLGAQDIVFDLVDTVDGHIIASQKFKQFVERAGIDGVDFVKINREPPLFDFRPRRVIPYDVECKPPRFENRCEKCGKKWGSDLNGGQTEWGSDLRY